MPGRFQDDKGNRSSYRELFYALIAVEILLLIFWCCLAYIEIHKTQSDLNGLAAILAIIVGIGGLGQLFKSIQKKYE
jgi:hypothetical protein